MSKTTPPLDERLRLGAGALAPVDNALDEKRRLADMVTELLDIGLLRFHPDASEQTREALAAVLRRACE